MTVAKYDWHLCVWSDGSDGRTAIRDTATGQLFDMAQLMGDEALCDLVTVLPILSELEDRIRDALGDPSTISLDPSVEMLPPVPVSASVFCAAANFTDHMQAMANKLGIEPEPDPHTLGNVYPYHFLKACRQSVVPGGCSVKLPTHAQMIDWEIELAAVIGKPARDVTIDEALSYVAGYAVSLDLSIRDRSFMKRPNVPDGSLFRTDFIGMKSFDGSCPIGPELTPAAGIPDPQKLGIELWVNGDAKQAGSTKDMIFSVAEQISHLSSRLTLLPGDVVLTGTPAGTGAESDNFLSPQDWIRCEIEGLAGFDMQVV